MAEDKPRVLTDAQKRAIKDMSAAWQIAEAAQMKAFNHLSKTLPGACERARLAGFTFFRLTPEGRKIAQEIGG